MTTSMIGSEPLNKRERRAEDRAREQLENRPEPPNLDVVPLEDGRVMIRELDDQGNILRETFGAGGKFGGDGNKDY